MKIPPEILARLLEPYTVTTIDLNRPGYEVEQVYKPPKPRADERVFSGISE